MPLAPAFTDIRSPAVLGLSDEDYADWLLRAINQGDVSIGGSQVGAIMGLSEYATPGSVWLQLLSLVAPVADDDAPVLRRGRALESIVASEYERVTGRVLARCSTLHGRDTTAIHLSNWMRFSPDRLIRPVPPRTSRGILEIKVLGRRTFDRTVNEGIDLSYYAQLQWYLFGLNRAWGAFAVFNADQWRLHAFDVERDDAFITEMLTRVRHFWNEYIMRRRDPEGLRNGAQAFLTRPPAQRGAEAVTLNTDEDRALLLRLALLDDARTAATAEYNRAVRDVQARMEELGHEAIRGAGLRISWREASRRTFDVERLREQTPRVIDEAQLREQMRLWCGGDAAAPAMLAEGARLADDIMARCTAPIDVDTFYRTSVSRPFRVTHEVERDVDEPVGAVVAGDTDA